MISANTAILSSSECLESEVESTLKVIEGQILKACSKNCTQLVTHFIVIHPSYLVRQAVYDRIRALGYSIVREVGLEGYQWHSISWGPVETPEERPWWKVWP